MFVSETNIFSPQTIKLSVVNIDGAAWQLDIPPDVTVEKLKVMALGHFLNPMDSIKLATSYKLVAITTNKVLINESTLSQENVKENDELLLLRKRRPISNLDPIEDRDQLSKGPSESTINEITANLASKNLTRSSEDNNAVVDFQTELRKILISLVDASQKILCQDPEVLPLFKEMHDKKIEKVVSDVDAGLIKQLTDMGFSGKKATKALQINKMVAVDAMDWLLEHGADNDSDSSDTEALIPSAKDDEVGEPSSKKAVCNRLYTVAEVLEAFKAYKRKTFRPNLRALVNLKEMGFVEEEVLDALRINNNNQDVACEWLLGDRHPTIQDMDKGLDPEGPIYKAVISNPIVQLGLNNPKTFLAFLHMLENPNTANHWLNDPDTAPLLSQIFRIYHAEKHSIPMQISSTTET